jgi:CRP-like cAMP-binding protein
MADFLEEKTREIRSRMEELKPLVDEYHRLQAAADALEGAISEPAPRRASGASAGSGRRARATPSRSDGDNGGRGRPKGSGTRGKEALALVQERPGITIPELADAMGIKQNYLYRVLPDLQKEGMVRKEGRGWHANAAA